MRRSSDDGIDSPSASSTYPKTLDGMAVLSLALLPTLTWSADGVGCIPKAGKMEGSLVSGGINFGPASVEELTDAVLSKVCYIFCLSQPQSGKVRMADISGNLGQLLRAKCGSAGLRGRGVIMLAVHYFSQQLPMQDHSPFCVMYPCRQESLRPNNKPIFNCWRRGNICSARSYQFQTSSKP